MLHNTQEQGWKMISSDCFNRSLRMVGSYMVGVTTSGCGKVQVKQLSSGQVPWVWNLVQRIPRQTRQLFLSLPGYRNLQ